MQSASLGFLSYLASVIQGSINAKLNYECHSDDGDISLVLRTCGWPREVFHCPQPTLMFRNSRSLCIIHSQILSLMPPEMRKVQLSPRSAEQWMQEQRTIERVNAMAGVNAGDARAVILVKDNDVLAIKSRLEALDNSHDIQLTDTFAQNS